MITTHLVKMWSQMNKMGGTGPLLPGVQTCMTLSSFQILLPYDHKYMHSKHIRGTLAL